MQILEGLILAGLLILALWFWKTRTGRSFSPPQTQLLPPDHAEHYALAKSIFVNAPERAFYSALIRAFYNSPARGSLILTKVRLEDIVGVAPHVKEPRLRWQLRGRVKSRHVDYLICAPGGRPIMAIELDGKSHDSVAAHPADALKNAIFDACGLPFRRVVTGEDFNRAAASAAFFVASQVKSPQLAPEG